ncbi:chibby -like 1 [Asbolus verrucosus]|uniref:Chibby-like 1 n=1 Tax=Asbolus verrucosus TaxID=1661398 RepID=A0A482VW84_ASBVE|nr:chibby -like 1 [Asbolus verrucosus]
MPLFGSKFSPKRAPLRKNSGNVGSEELEDLVLNQRTVQLRLGEQELVFENGEWIPESGQSGSAHKSNQKLRKKLQELQEENNMLRLKYTVMLNMLTQTTAESHLQEKELEKLRTKK